MLGNIDIIRLKQKKEDLEAWKQSKLAFVTCKHIGDRYNMYDLFNHLQEEIAELNNAIEKTVLPNKAIMEELVDISNLIDLIFDAITSSWIYKFDEVLFGVKQEKYHSFL